MEMTSGAPDVTMSVVVSSDLSVRVFSRNVLIFSSEQLCIPSKISDFRVLVDLLDSVESYTTKKTTPKQDEVQGTLKLWWKIVNVTTPEKGHRQRDVWQEPVRDMHCQQIEFLDNFVTWLDAWSCRGTHFNGLTKETHFALRLSTYALIEQARYCLHELGFRYVLLGKFQTDSLEARFGKYRQLYGSQYNVSITQVFEAETKIRLQNTLVLEDLPSSKQEGKTLNVDTLISKYITLTEESLKVSASDMHAITYIAGYCAYAALKRQPCDDCRAQLTVADRELEHRRRWPELEKSFQLTCFLGKLPVKGQLQVPVTYAGRTVNATLVVLGCSGPNLWRRDIIQAFQLTGGPVLKVDVHDDHLDTGLVSPRELAALTARHVILKPVMRYIGEGRQRKLLSTQEALRPLFQKKDELMCSHVIVHWGHRAVRSEYHSRNSPWMPGCSKYGLFESSDRIETSTSSKTHRWTPGRPGKGLQEAMAHHAGHIQVRVEAHAAAVGVHESDARWLERVFWRALSVSAGPQ
ncbi:hypothetical protein HPB50_018691 [Hyalomma asiaticum]|uniref:Uncharacterized protein n=1 Tax=Hyalomma asiaticum TaxID=266040 RepID=A0ACB7T9B7_HYAAI|nr:hypothetical protein HPB50_018691 [Hyalomma asiaticum]